MDTLVLYRDAFRMSAQPVPGETSALLLPTRTSRPAITAHGRTITVAESRRFFQIWQ